VKEEKTEGFFRSERAFGKFYRSIPLPKGAKTELVKAELVNGILTVTIPVPEVKPALKQVPIVAKVDYAIAMRVVSRLSLGCTGRGASRGLSASRLPHSVLFS
jgi:hypothetical protein